MARRTKKRATKRQLRRTAKRKVLTGGNPDKESKVEEQKSPLEKFQGVVQKVTEGLSPPPVNRASKSPDFVEFVKRMQETPKPGTVASLRNKFNVPKLASVVEQAMEAAKPIESEPIIAKPPERHYMNMSGPQARSLYTKEVKESNLVSKPVITVKGSENLYEIINNNNIIATKPPRIYESINPRPQMPLPSTKSSQLPLQNNPTTEKVFTRADYTGLKKQERTREGALARLVNEMKKQKSNLSSKNLIKRISEIAGERFAKTNTGFRFSPIKRNVLSAKNTRVIANAFKKNVKKNNPLYNEEENTYNTEINEGVRRISVVAGNETAA